MGSYTTSNVVGVVKDEVMPIAVIGIGFRGPGEATDVEKFWNMIFEAREARTLVPKEKWNNEAFYHPDSNRNGTSNVLAGHYFKDDLAKFDAPFFNMTNAEAESLDPQQRLLLECTYEALENAGIPIHRASGSKTSVFVGSFCGDYTDILMRDPETVPLYQATSSGHSRAIISNRISYFFDFSGPSVTIDTACSSSLVALHLACQSLRTGESTQAVVAGANVILSHEMTISMSMMRFLSPDGRCYTFDDRANGYSRGEGVASLILKPLDNALKDGDTIRAVILNSGINQDGRTAGITLPSRQAQESLIETLYAQAGLDPAETDFVECHGTGTPAGDPLEARAISETIGRKRPQNQPVRIGSVKTNVGHLEGASGVAGVIKAILMLENETILPNRNFVNGNPNIPFKDWNLAVPTAAEPWHTTGPRRVSINSFGYGGTNSHAILEQATSFLKSRGLSGNTMKTLSISSHDANGRVSNQTNGHIDPSRVNGINHKIENDFFPDNIRVKGSTNRKNARIFTISAFDEAAGKAQARRLSQYVRDRLDHADDYFMADLAYSLGERRSKLPYKFSANATSAKQLIESLDNSAVQFTRTKNIPGLAFVFTGQGAQWYAMGRELNNTEPVYRKSLIKTGKYLRSLGADWDVLEELSKDESTSRVSLLSQALCSAIQIALVDLLASWNIRPVAVTGHSSGEIAAAYCVGALSAEDAMAAAYYRGIYSNALRDSGIVDGGMAAVGMAREAVLPILAGLSQGKATVACENSPQSITLSGDTSAITELEAVMKTQGIFFRRLPVTVAYHSSHMRHVADKYLAAISHIKVKTDDTGIEFFSSVTGRRADYNELGPSYWVRNLLGEVKFSDSLRTLCLEACSSKKTRRRKEKSSINTIVELGPHSALAGPIKQIIQGDKRLMEMSIQYQSVLVRKSSAIDTAYALASKLWLMGCPVDLGVCNKSASEVTPKVLADLPPYAWNHSNSYWAEPRISKTFRNRKYARTDILGAPDKGANPLEPRWRNVVRTSEIPWVKDHKVQTNVIYPAAGYLVMAIEAANQRACDRGAVITGYRLREVTIGQALVIPEHGGEVETLITLRPFSEGTRQSSDIWDEFYVYSVTEDDRWTEHCHGLVSVQKELEPNDVTGDTQIVSETQEHLDAMSKIDSNSTLTLDIGPFYQNLTEIGLEYGPTFANVISARVGPNTCIGTITIPDTASSMPMGFQYPVILHPATLDSMFHGLFAAVAANQSELNDPMVPIFLRELYVNSSITSKPNDQLTFYTSTEQKDSRQTIASVRVASNVENNGHPAVVISGLTCTKLASDAVQQVDDGVKSFAYNMKWELDVDLLSSSDIDEMCGDIRPSSKEAKRIRGQEQVGYYFMKTALTTLSLEHIKNMLPYHKRLWECMQTFVAAVEEGKLVIPTESWKTSTPSEQDKLIDEIGNSGAEGALLCHVGGHLSSILSRKEEALALMIEEGRLDAYYRDNCRFDRNYQAAARYINLLGHKNPHLNILEIGAGTGGATLPLLQALGGADGDLARFNSFDFTDISSGFFDAAKEKLAAWSGLIRYSKLDIEKDPNLQGYELGTYDVVVAANVLHATKSMHNTMTNVRKLLKPGGKLILVELTRERMTTSTIFGTLPGWWAGEEDGRTKGPTLTEEEWVPVLQEAGFSGLEAAVWDSPTEFEHQGSMMVAEAVGDEDPKQENDVLLITSNAPSELPIHALSGQLVEANLSVSCETLISANPAGRLCIVLAEVVEPILSNPNLEEFEAVKRIFTTATGILWVVRGASSLNPATSLVTGFARTVRSEYGSIRTIVLDLDPEEDITLSTMQQICALFQLQFLDSVPADKVTDVEYALRNGKFSIPRLAEDAHANNNVNTIITEKVPESQRFNQPDRPLVIEVGTPGLLDTIRFVDDARTETPLQDDQVEVEVKATGLNFKDVMMAMGQVEYEAPGLECSGVVRAVGESVTNVVMGDRVSFFAFGAFSNIIRSKAISVQKIPDFMSWELAAALPVTYNTAYYSIFQVARVQKGETVLIHAASGGLGQAMIELCKGIGAEIFVTVGTGAKRELLVEQFGIPMDHIFSSRDGSFAQGIRSMTNGRGVDVIMNSVAGEMLRITWECIAPFGRFVELGARDYTINTRLEMHKFERNVTFSLVNLVSLVRERPEVAAQVWSDVMAMFRKRELKGPSPLTIIGISELEKGFRTMQSGKHTGKLVAVPQPDENVMVLPRDIGERIFRADSSYLLVGGLGGLGRAIALWMVKRGAINLIFASRSGDSKPEARDLVQLLQRQNVRVSVHSCDISDPLSLGVLLKKTEDMAPIRGVIQGAMVLRDTLIENMTLRDYEEVVRPKVQGTWNLHNMLPYDLDFFLMLSSTSGIIGNASQAAYAAASTFLDSMARYRKARGRPAATVDLGVILGVGYVAENKELAKHLERQGFEGTTEQELTGLIEVAIRNQREPDLQSQMISGLGTWNEAQGAAYSGALFSHFRRAALKSTNNSGQNGEGKGRIQDEIREATSLDQAASIVCEAIIAKVASLSMIPIEDINPSRPMSEYGMDSLVAVEMRNWLFRELDATVPILELLSNKPLTALSLEIAKRSKLLRPSLIASTES